MSNMDNDELYSVNGNIKIPKKSEMLIMEKPVYMSKTFWAAVLGICGVVSGYLLETIDTATALTQLAAFMGMFGLRDAL